MSLEKTLRTAEEMEGVFKAAKEILSKQDYDFDYHFNKLKGYARVLFDKYAPFKDGDRIKLSQDVEVLNSTSGWYGSRHMLIKDALGTVNGVDYNAEKGWFTADVEFDIESWICEKSGISHGPNDKWLWEDTTLTKTERPVSSRHTWHFSEKYLKKVSPGDESEIIYNEPLCKKRIRIYFRVVDAMLANHIIDKEYKAYDCHKLGEYFNSTEELTKFITGNSKIRLDARLPIPVDWRTMCLEQMIRFIAY